MSVLILDAGNSIIKAKIARRERSEIAFPHAIKQLTEAEYTNILARAGASGPPQDYLRINGQPYAVAQAPSGMASTCNGQELPDIPATTTGSSPRLP